MTYQIIDGYKISPSCGKVLRTGHGRTVGRCLRNARRQHPALYGGGYFIVVDGKDMTAKVNAQLARREELAARCCSEKAGNSSSERAAIYGARLRRKGNFRAIRARAQATKDRIADELALYARAGGGK